MKTTIRKSLLSVLLVFLFIGCNFEIIQKDKNEITLKLKNIWNEDINSYDKKSKKLEITKRFDRACFDISDVEIKGKYLIIEYEDLSGYLTVEVVYSDDSKNETACYSKKSKDFVVLNQNKKLKEMNFVSMLDETMSVTIKKVYFADEFDIEKEAIVDSKESGSFNNVSSINQVKSMGVGFNTGNFLEVRTTGIESGVAFYDNVDVKKTWGISDFTADKFKLLGTAGGKSVRIPVSWANHIIDEKYTIDPYWMEDVKSYVDLAISQGYYVILNDHSIREHLSKPLAYHEGYITRNTTQDIEESEKYIKAVWGQISTAFNNSYDEHLMFETFNEPRNQEENTSHAAHMWKAATGEYTNCAECIADHKILNEYNQIIVDTIRKSGGNNAKRFILIPSIGCDYDTALSNYFVLPKDSATDKLIVTIHHYPLWDGLLDTWKENNIKQIYSSLNEKFTSKGIPVIIGELGHAADNSVLTSNIGREATRAEKLAPSLVVQKKREDMECVQCCFIKISLGKILALQKK